MDLSLDDIIKNKRIQTALSRKLANKALTRKRLRTEPTKLPRIRDARLKIIQKNREKIRDAREKLSNSQMIRAGSDARLRLLQKQNNMGTSFKDVGFRNGYNGNVPKHFEFKTLAKPIRRQAPILRPKRPELVNAPRGYVDYDNMERMEEEEYAVATRLCRTVTNDEMHHYPGFVDSRDVISAAAARRDHTWGVIADGDHFDPFDVYEMPVNARTERYIRRKSPERDGAALPPAKTISRPNFGVGDRRPNSSSLQIYDRRFASEDSSRLSYEMRSRLQHAPDPHASMGIFSKEISEPSGYRIVVSNLHPSVSHADVKELFMDIGELYDSRLVRPGIAEVIYKSLIDAEKAVDTYHNRQLDGLPMKCLLVNPRSSSRPTAPAINTPGSPNSKQAISKTPLEIDIDALHKVLFRRH